MDSLLRLDCSIGQFSAVCMPSSLGGPQYLCRIHRAVPQLDQLEDLDQLDARGSHKEQAYSRNILTSFAGLFLQRAAPVFRLRPSSPRLLLALLVTAMVRDFRVASNVRVIPR